MTKKEYLTNLYKEFEKDLTTIHKITSDAYHVNLVESDNKVRKRILVTIRQIAHTLSKAHTKAPESAIALFIGDKERTTVIHSIKTVNNLREFDKKFDEKFLEIEKSVKHYLEFKDEIWKDIPGYEGFYQISNFMNVRGLDRWLHYKDGSVRFHKGGIISISSENRVILRKHNVKSSPYVKCLYVKVFTPELIK